MLERNRQVEEKRDELYNLKWNDFIDRVLAYEGHDSSRLQDSAQKIKDAGYPEVNQKEKDIMIARFAGSTFCTAKLSGKDMPENFYGHPQWSFKTGSEMGFRTHFGLTKEESGKVAVHVTTQDMKSVRIGYLDDDFVAEHPLVGDMTVPGSYEKGMIEIPIDLEKLHNEMSKEPCMTTEGGLTYKRPFAMCNTQYTSDPYAFERALNNFPVADSLNEVFVENGLDASVTNVSWRFDTNEYDRYGATIIETDQPLTGQQMALMNRTLIQMETEGKLVDRMAEVFVEHDGKRMMPPKNKMFEQYMSFGLEEMRKNPAKAADLDMKTDDQDFADAVASISAGTMQMEQ